MAEETIKDVRETLMDKQKNLVYALIGYFTDTPITNIIGRHVNRTLRG
jgi:hypothetical protein